MKSAVYSTLLLLAAAVPLSAQSWQAAAGYQHEFIDSNELAWNDWRRLAVSVSRTFTGGAVAAELSRNHRFARDEDAVAIDVYRTLWRGSYGNVRMSVAPNAETVPDVDVYGEVFQSVGAGWELSGSYRYMHFNPEPVHALGVGAGYFVGKAYLRARATATRQAGNNGALVGASARIGSRDDFVEFAAGSGREITIVSASVTELRTTSYGLVRAQKFVTSHLGLSANAGLNRFRGIPNRTFVGGSVLWRW